jgi:hypothetical protein
MLVSLQQVMHNHLSVDDSEAICSTLFHLSKNSANITEIVRNNLVSNLREVMITHSLDLTLQQDFCGGLPWTKERFETTRLYLRSPLSLSFPILGVDNRTGTYLRGNRLTLYSLLPSPSSSSPTLEGLKKSRRSPDFIGEEERRKKTQGPKGCAVLHFLPTNPKSNHWIQGHAFITLSRYVTVMLKLFAGARMSSRRFGALTEKTSIRVVIPDSV